LNFSHASFEVHADQRNSKRKYRNIGTVNTDKALVENPCPVTGPDWREPMIAGHFPTSLCWPHVWKFAAYKLRT